jgi:hypothetical protein
MWTTFSEQLRSNGFPRILAFLAKHSARGMMIIRSLIDPFIAAAAVAATRNLRDTAKE